MTTSGGDAKESNKDRRRRESHEASAAYYADPRWRELLGDHKVLQIDGGAKAGMQKEWVPLRPLLELLAFDPVFPADADVLHSMFDVGDAVEFATVGRAGKFRPYPAATTFIPMALGGESGVRRFHMTVGSSMSSFLTPDIEAASRYGLRDYATIRETVDVQTTTLDEVVDERGVRFVDFIKLDTQGTELEVLEGGARTLRELVFGMKVEVGFVPLYENQPLFHEIDSHVRAQGFEMIDLLHQKRFSRGRSDADEASRETGRSSMGPGQLVVSDPLYFRRISAAVDRVESLSDSERTRYLAGALITCLVYSRVDYARELIASVRPLIDPHVADTALVLLDAFPLA